MIQIRPLRFLYCLAIFLVIGLNWGWEPALIASLLGIDLEI